MLVVVVIIVIAAAACFDWPITIIVWIYDIGVVVNIILHGTQPTPEWCYRCRREMQLSPRPYPLLLMWSFGDDDLFFHRLCNRAAEGEMKKEQFHGVCWLLCVLSFVYSSSSSQMNRYYIATRVMKRSTSSSAYHNREQMLCWCQGGASARVFQRWKKYVKKRAVINFSSNFNPSKLLFLPPKESPPPSISSPTTPRPTSNFQPT